MKPISIWEMRFGDVILVESRRRMHSGELERITHPVLVIGFGPHVDSSPTFFGATHVCNVDQYGADYTYFLCANKYEETAKIFEQVDKLIDVRPAD